MACVFWGVRLWHYLLGQVPIKKLQQLRLGYHLSLNIDSYLGKWLPSIFIVWSLFRSQNCRNCAQIIKLSWNIVWGKWQPLISPIFWVCIIHRTCCFFAIFWPTLEGVYYTGVRIIHDTLQYPLTKGFYLFGQIVINDESMHAIVSEKLSHSTTRVWSQVLQGSSIGSCRTDNDGVLHGI